jgi:tetratricopeptide (TPR) repeat protein
MARFQKQGPKRTKPHAAVATQRARREPMAPSIEDTMFFPRLRRHAKWMFVLLALVFGLGFVAFGVGAGGIGIGDVFRGSAGGGPSISDAQERAEERPQDPEAWRDLVIALQAAQRTEEALEAQRRVVELVPKDASELRQLASLQITLLQEKQTQAQLVQAAASIDAAGQNFPSFTVDGRPVLDDPIGEAINAKAAARLQLILGEAQTAASGAVDAYRQLVELLPRDPTVQIELADVATQTGDYATAISAYERYLELVPADDTNAAFVKRQLEQLRAAQAATAGASG